MSAKDKNLSEHKQILDTHAGRYNIAIVVSEYHEEITGALKKACINTLLKFGVKEKNITVQTVPGAFELPLAAKWIFGKTNADAIICLGCVVKGDTDHDVYINQSVSNAIMQLNLETGVPFIFGVLTPNTIEQARERAGGKYGNKGEECAIAALHMLAIK